MKLEITIKLKIINPEIKINKKVKKKLLMIVIKK